MRIQHNIMAMNAYRNYNNNNKALSGNLEKLSSGYKINRAGDDAAGLAISEKMRAQITGLNAAQKNVKDGISLVKTAEGAMQEIQDMLNRMDYLATQSANGTYDDEVDRANLQKEVEALKTEINRIADSANFNGIKLLDGSKDADSSQAASDAANAALTAAQEAAAKAAEKLQAAKDGNATLSAEDLKAFTKDLTAQEVKDVILPAPNPTPGTPSTVGSSTILETDTIKVKQPSFQANFDGVSHTLATTNGAAGTGVTLTIGTGATSTAINLTEQDIYNYLTNEKGVDADDIDVSKGYTVDAKDLVGALVYKFENTANGIGNTVAGSMTSGATTPGAGCFGDDTNAWEVKASEDGKSLVFEFADTNAELTATVNKHFDVRLQGQTQATQKATAGVATIAATAGSNTANTATYTVTLNDGSNDITFQTSAISSGASLADIATALGKATATIDGKEVRLKDLFTVGSGTNSLTFTDKTKGEEGNGYTVKSVVSSDTANANVTTIGSTVDTVDGTNEFKTGTSGYVNAGTEVVLTGAPAQSEQLASTSIDFNDLDITDGMQITLGQGDKAVTYTFAVGKNSLVATKDENGNKLANVIDLTDIEADKLTKGQTGSEVQLALSRFSEAAKDNGTFTVSHEGGTSKMVGLKQKSEVKADTDMTTMDKLVGYIKISTTDPTAAQAAANDAKEANIKNLEKAKADADKAVEDAQKAADKAAAKAEVGKPLTLQIGDTSDKFNQMDVKIGDMHTSAMGTGKATLDGEEIEVTKTIADVDVGDQASAAEAVQVIKNAINYVSSVRGDLGAIQNRLDHTANNLSVMAENIQDAESTIRDTDVAEEMMSYVKNNILVQSAQAMLAQANQVPQGVLQLLG